LHVGSISSVHIDPYGPHGNTACFSNVLLLEFLLKFAQLAWIMIFIEFFFLSNFHILLNCFERFLLL